MMHRWGPPSRPDPHHTHRACIRLGCGATKVSRHEGDRHWIEYRDGDKVRDREPPCFGDAALVVGALICQGVSQDDARHIVANVAHETESDPEVSCAT